MAVRHRDGHRLFPSWRDLLLKGAARLAADGQQAEADLVRALLNIDETDYLQAAERLRNGLGPDWTRFLKEQIDLPPEEVEDASLALARAVWALGSRLIVTTNYDRVLDWACPSRWMRDLDSWDIEAPAEQAELLRRGGLRSPTVWHLHGRIRNAANLILTPDGYRRLYPGDGGSQARHAAAIETLRHLLASRSLLFIGFSFSDRHFGVELESVLETFMGHAARHYALTHRVEMEVPRRDRGAVLRIPFEAFGEPLVELAEALGRCREPSATAVSGAHERTQALPPQIGHYRLEDRLGAGGMGEVYRAFDERLERPVAIKIIRADYAQTERARHRFRREARLIANLVHPSIVRLYHLLAWQSRECIVMELVEGQTLTEVLQEGPLDGRRALPLLWQITAGIAHAHELGIIHRDLKTDNVMVTPEGHAKILDFGLAKRLVASTEEPPTPAQPGAVLGTLASLAPEQARGEAVDYRSDLFSLGVLFYRVLTGRAPFRGDTRDEILARVLVSHPPAPSKLNFKIPAALSELTIRLLQKEPAARPQGAVEVAAVLRDIAQGLGGVVGFFDVGAVTTLVEARPAVAVSKPRNASGLAAADWLATALAEMLSVGLGLGDTIRVVRVPDVSRGGEAVPVAAEAADFAVVGSFGFLGAASDTLLRVELELRDLRAADGAAVAAERATGTTRNLVDLAHRAVRNFRRHLGAPTPAARAEIAACFPTDPRCYFEGLEALQRHVLTSARQSLAEAAAAEPAHPLPWMALSVAQWLLGYESQACDAAGRAAAVADHLPGRAQQAIEGWLATTCRDVEQAVKVYEGLLRSYPDELAWGLWLARSLAASGHVRRAASTLEKLQQHPAPGAGDPRIDLALAAMAWAVGDPGGCQEHAARGAAAAQAKVLDRLAGRASMYWAMGLQGSGRGNEARAALERARELFAGIGDQRGLAESYKLAAAIRLAEGDSDGARRSFERCLSAYRQAGDGRGAARGQRAMGEILARQGRRAQAERCYNEALATFRELGARTEEAVTLAALAACHSVGGDSKAALQCCEEALILFAEFSDWRGMGVIFTLLADTLWRAGELEQARFQYEEARAVYRHELEDPTAIAVVEERLAALAAATAGEREDGPPAPAGSLLAAAWDDVEDELLPLGIL